MKQIYQTKKSGFSLIEALIAIGIFSLVSVMIVGTFSSFFKNYVAAKKAQRSTESAQYAMNLMAKTLRTSTIASSGNTETEIRAFDNSTGECVVYNFNSTLKKIEYSSVAPATAGDIATCNWSSTLTELTPSGDISSARFSSTATVAPVFGKVVISLGVQSGGTTSLVQSTVSLRQ